MINRFRGRDELATAGSECAGPCSVGWLSVKSFSDVDGSSKTVSISSVPTVWYFSGIFSGRFIIFTSILTLYCMGVLYSV